MYKRKLKHDYDNIYQRHLAGEPILKISKETGIHVQTIYTHFQKNNWTYNKDIQIRQDGYYVNDNYLDAIDSEDKAYFLGWMLSDGNVCNNHLTLKLNYNDEYIIKEMFGKFSTGHTVTIDKNGRAMQVSSTKLINSLKSLGCVENKTVVGFNLPNIPNDLFKHFVRGYFDGDGSIGIRSARPNQLQISICSVDNNFLNQLKNKLLEFNINSQIYKENRSGISLKTPTNESNINCKDMFRIVFPTHEERLKFYDFIYSQCTIKLQRKYDKYTEYYQNTIAAHELEKSNEKLILKLHGEGYCKFKIHKETNIGRSVIESVLKRNYMIT